MPGLVTPLLLAMALSLDGFGAGITYGLRKTKIPWLSVLIISLCTGVMLCISMLGGSLLQRFLPPSFASAAGAVMLMALGCWSLFQQITAGGAASDADRRPMPDSQVLLQQDEAAAVDDGSMDTPKSEVFKLEIRKLGLVIQIMKSPAQADLDRSGSISPREALWLGTALSLDAFAAGLGAAMLGLSPWLTSAAAAVCSGTFLALGMKAGFRAAAFRGTRLISCLPALILFIMGMMKLL